MKMKCFSQFRLALSALAAVIVALTTLPAHTQNAAPARAATNTPDVNVIAQRMADAQQANHARMRAYSLTRQYSVFDKTPEDPKSQVIAHLNFLPPDKKDYSIEKSSGGMSERVVRHILDHEMQVTRNPKDIALTSDNYEFTLKGEEQKNGHDCYVIELHPKEKDKDLIQGLAWIDKTTYNVVHMEGSPAKSPSFWVKEVKLTLDFADVEGLWLQTSMEANAKVRFGGSFNIASRDLSHETASAVADNRPARTPFRDTAARSSRPAPRRSTATPFFATALPR